MSAILYLGNFFGWKEIIQTDGHVRNAKRVELLADLRCLFDEANKVDQPDDGLLFFLAATRAR